MQQKEQYFLAQSHYAEALEGLKSKAKEVHQARWLCNQGEKELKRAQGNVREVQLQRNKLEAECGGEQSARPVAPAGHRLFADLEGDRMAAVEEWMSFCVASAEKLERLRDGLKEMGADELLIDEADAQLTKALSDVRVSKAAYEAACRR
ncbi:hypothetical protein NLJ89_g11295 [Agrocybe chaxingu]|uniref:Uncharacterized protein n=1 Tax=Agrocybe chaxingu TaxID=84603 RepID=A0A9W8JWJ8_9AGAR|nr:hypothetical protein NLJ89_g11295 [Agrocybe chaxingu]